jgi:hypothetical protein
MTITCGIVLVASSRESVASVSIIGAPRVRKPIDSRQRHSNSLRSEMRAFGSSHFLFETPAAKPAADMHTELWKSAYSSLIQRKLALRRDRYDFSNLIGGKSVGRSNGPFHGSNCASAA